MPGVRSLKAAVGASKRLELARKAQEEELVQRPARATPAVTPETAKSPRERVPAISNP